MKRRSMLLISLAISACGGGQSRSSTSSIASPSWQGSASTAATPISIYNDALAAGWADWSWATHNLANTSPVASGTDSIAVTYAPWTGLYFHGSAATAGLSYLDLQVNGGATAGVALNAKVTIGGVEQAAAGVGPYCAGNSIPANAWTHCLIPLSALGAANTTIDGVILQEAAGLSLPTLYVDALQISPAVTPSYIYRDALVSPWADWSWATHSLANASPVAAGSDSISVTFAPWTGLYFSHPGFSTAGRSTLSLMANGGATSGAALVVKALVNGNWTTGTPLGPTCTGASIPAGQWTTCTVPLSAIAPVGATLTGVMIQEGAGKTLPAMYLDEIGFDTQAGSGGATAVAVAVSPATVTLAAGLSQQFTATVTGSADTTATWSLEETSGCGQISATGLYTAPASAATCHVVATSHADSSKTATATVTVTTSAPAVAIAVSPATVTLAAGLTQQFTATVTGSADTTATWSLKETSGCGQVSATGFYTAPASTATCHVVATSHADSTKTATATVTVTAPPPVVAVTVSPASASVSACQSLTLATTVTGSSNTAVSWSVQEGSSGGTVTTAGVYTAPATPGTYHVIATSNADGTKSATATLTVSTKVLSVAVSPATVTVPEGGSAQFTATVTTTCGQFTATQTVTN